MQDEQQSTPPARPARKPYAKPKLVYFGRLAEITKTVGTLSSTTDFGPPKGVNKTR
jgi:hypothetical protein